MIAQSLEQDTQQCGVSVYPPFASHLLDEVLPKLATAPRVIHEASADSLTTDREIDALVYELYGLTEGEIATVEGNLSTDAR